MSDPTTRRVGRALWGGCAALVLCCQGVAAQGAYTAANGFTTLLSPDQGFLSIDFTEAKIGLAFRGGTAGRCAEIECAPTVSAMLYGSAAARKGQRDLFERLDFNPGYDAAAGLAYVVPRAAGYDLLYFRGTYSSHARDIVEEDVAAQLATLDESIQHTVAASLGYTRAFSGVTMVGVGVEVRRELGSPGARAPREFCTPGTTATGIRVFVCSDRYEGPLPDLWTGQARADAGFALARLGSGGGAATLGLQSAVALDFIEGANREVSVAVGPAIHLHDHPGIPMLVLTVGLRDAFDANGLPVGDPERGSYLSDHLLVRLSLNAPLAVLAGT